MVGIDVLAHVARNFAESRGSDASATTLPAFIETMLERRWLGDKTGQGFYKKDPQAKDPRNNRLALDWHTLDYRAAGRPKFPSVEMAKNAESLPERLRLVLGGDVKKDKAAAFLFPLLTGIWNYAADCLPEIADSAASIDRAMRTGFNWETGPVRDVGCRWSGRDSRTTSHCRSACEPAGGSAARRRQRQLV